MNPYARETIISALDAPLLHCSSCRDEIVTLLRGDNPWTNIESLRAKFIFAVSLQKDILSIMCGRIICARVADPTPLFSGLITPPPCSLLSPLSLRFCTIRYYTRTDKSVERDLMLSRAQRTKEPKDDWIRRSLVCYALMYSWWIIRTCCQNIKIPTLTSFVRFEMRDKYWLRIVNSICAYSP
jgi:hypothetical protein